MFFVRLSQQFGVRCGFLSEPEISKYRYGIQNLFSIDMVARVSPLIKVWLNL